MFFFFLHFPLSGPVLTNISLLIIPCMIVYVTNNKEPRTLNTGFFDKNVFRVQINNGRQFFFLSGIYRFLQINSSYIYIVF